MSDRLESVVGSLQTADAQWVIDLHTNHLALTGAVLAAAALLDAPGTRGHAASLLDCAERFGARPAPDTVAELSVVPGPEQEQEGA